MKTKQILFTLILSTILIGNHVFANPGFRDDKTTFKARKAVEEAAPDDWLTLAKSAEACIKKNVNLKEAAEWIDKSLAIKETSYNLKVKGDYYLKNNLPNEAISTYILSLKKAHEENPNSDPTALQEKITEIRASQGKGN